LASLLLSSCGGDKTPSTVITLADGYDAIGAGRILPDGLTPAALQMVQFSLEIQASGGHAVGRIQRTGGTPAMIMGDFDTMGVLSILPLDGAVTGTTAERIEHLGANALDAKPTDGIADELAGYLRTSRSNGRVFDGSFFATSRISGRPAAPDASKITIAAMAGGKARVVGTAGAVPAIAGIESYAYNLADHDPKQSQGQAGSDGAFQFTVDALEGDLILLRANQVGIVGPMIGVTVSH
jgi:hypothetical protein